MTRKPVAVAAWLWAIVVALWAGRACYDALRSVSPDVVVGGVIVVAVVALTVTVRRSVRTDVEPAPDEVSIS